jgi:hypothetical protein
MQKQKVNRKDEEFTIDEPSHWLYTGVTETGKTTLARFHARTLATAKHRVYVYDPVRTETAGGAWEKCSMLKSDPDEASEQIEELQDCFVFVDEARDLLGHDRRENHWMLRRGRHQGIYFRLVCQRPTMLPPDVRTQCSRLFMFRLASTDSQEICADFGHGASTYKQELDRGDCVMIMSGSPKIETFNCFDLVGSGHSPNPRKEPSK